MPVYIALSRRCGQNRHGFIWRSGKCISFWWSLFIIFSSWKYCIDSWASVIFRYESEVPTIFRREVGMSSRSPEAERRLLRDGLEDTIWYKSVHVNKTIKSSKMQSQTQFGMSKKECNELLFISIPCLNLIKEIHITRWIAWLHRKCDDLAKKCVLLKNKVIVI